MVITMSLINSANVIAYDRAFEVLSGVLIALSFNFIFCPYKQNKQLEKIFFDVIRKSHNYFCHSINNFTNIEQDEDKVTKKALNKLLLDIENVKNSKITLFSDQDMLSQQQAIHSTAEKLVANMYQLRKLSTEIVNINIPAEHEVIISSLCHDLDRKLRRILKNRKIWTSKSHSALHEALYNSSNSKLDIKIIMLLNCLDELYDIILKVNTICSPKKRKRKSLSSRKS